MKKKLPIIFIILCIILAITIVILVYELYKFNVIPQKVYTAKDFNINTIKSSIDYNNNGIDDYKDILLGARVTQKIIQHIIVNILVMEDIHQII